MTLDELERIASKPWQERERWEVSDAMDALPQFIARLRATEALVFAAWSEAVIATGFPEDIPDDWTLDEWNNSHTKAALDRLREGA